MTPSTTQPCTQSAASHPTALMPFNIIRTETVLSRLPIHNLSKKGMVHIHITNKNAHGDIELRWEVSYNDRYGPPRQLAYKFDTILLNRTLEACGRPLPRIIRLNSLRQLCQALGVHISGANTRALQQAIHQNAGAYITATLRYTATDGTERTLEAGFTRYSVVFTGERLPDGTTADAVYLLLNEPYWEVLNSAPTRPLDYDYLKALPPAAQRCYEIISYKIFTALKYQHPHAKLLYSEYCTFAAQQRYADYDHVKKQMDKVHKPHVRSGYLEKVSYEATQDGEGHPDWVMFYVPGAKAKAEYTALHGRNPSRTTGTLRREGRGEVTGTPSPAAAEVLTTPAHALPPEAGDAAHASLARHARELVSHFRQGLAEPPTRRPSPQELQQAEGLLRAQGEERARAIVTYALQQAPQTGFQMQHFGAVLGYQDAAAAPHRFRPPGQRRQAMPDQATYHHTLVMHFFGDLLKRTMDAPTAAAHQQALLAFLEDLSLWVLPDELPTLLGPAFTLFDACEFTPTADGTDEDVAVALSPQGAVVFRAWLRRRGVDPVLCSS